MRFLKSTTRYLGNHREKRKKGPENKKGNLKKEKFFRGSSGPK
jgi:hypothetical protein